MTWTDEDKQHLLHFKEIVDSDDIKCKEIIKKLLLSNKYILHVLNNTELEKDDAEPEDYYLENVLPYYVITETLSDVKHFVCFEVSYRDLQRYDRTKKLLQIVFYILINEHDAIELDTGIARHDLIAALIQDQFNFTNYFGVKIELVEDTAGAVDRDYILRTLTFQQIVDNNLIKDGKYGNKEIHILA